MTRLVACIIGFVVLLCGVSLSGAASAQQIEITFAKRYDVHGSIEAGQRYIERVIAEFERRNPHIKVHYQPLTGDWIEKLTTELIAGTAPDVFEMWGDFAVNWAENGLLLDLQPYVDRDFDADYIRGFYPGQWEATVLVSGPNAGMRYGIPRYTNSTIIFYNKDAFDQAGLPTPHQLEQEGRWTWDTFLESAKRVMRTNGDLVTMWGYHEYRWAQWVYSNGGKVFNWPEAPTEYMLDRQEAVEALEFLRSLIWEHQVVPPDRWSTTFSRGDLAMSTHWGSCCIRGIEAEVMGQFEWDIAPLPVGPKGIRQGAVFLDMWAISKSSKHPDAAWEFVKFLLSPEAMAMAAWEFGEQPAHLSGVEEYVRAFEDVNVIYAIEESMRALPWYDAVVPRAAQVNQLINPAIEDGVFQNTKPVRTAVEEIRSAIEALF